MRDGKYARDDARPLSSDERGGRRVSSSTSWRKHGRDKHKGGGPEGAQGRRRRERRQDKAGKGKEPERPERQAKKGKPEKIKEEKIGAEAIGDGSGVEDGRREEGWGGRLGLTGGWERRGERKERERKVCEMARATTSENESLCEKKRKRESRESERALRRRRLWPWMGGGRRQSRKQKTGNLDNAAGKEYRDGVVAGGGRREDEDDRGFFGGDVPSFGFWVG